MEVHITDKFEVKQFYSIQNASVAKPDGVQDYLLRKFWAPDEGPDKALAGSGRKANQQHVDDPFAALAKTVAANKAEAESKLNEGYVDMAKDFVGTERKRIVSERLRAASEKAKASCARCRWRKLRFRCRIRGWCIVS